MWVNKMVRQMVEHLGFEWGHDWDVKTEERLESQNKTKIFKVRYNLFAGKI